MSKLAAPIVINRNKRVKFDPAVDYVLQNDAPMQKYVKGFKQTGKNEKFGQLKLLVSEIQFLNLYWRPNEIPNPIFLYIGAGVSYHTPILANLFPDVEFHLYDKFDESSLANDFFEGLHGLPNVKLFEKYFEDEDIEKYRKLDNVFLVSDIRSLTFADGEGHDTIETEEIVIKDMLLQQHWVKSIMPVASHLKFRLPYKYKFSEKDLEAHPLYPKDDGFEYLKGTVYFQAWSSASTTETRLVSTPPYTTQMWDYDKYEQMLAHHSSNRRHKTVYSNPITGGKEVFAPDLGLSNTYFSTLTLHVGIDYLTKVGAEVTYESLYVLMNYWTKYASGSTDKTLVEYIAGKKFEDDEDDE